MNEKEKIMAQEKIKKNISIEKNGCWIWKLAKNRRTGYGTVRCKTNGKRDQMLAHRYSWEAFQKEPFENLCVCHKCDVRSCVNPDHLFLGTYKDNIHDMMKKKRFPCLIGERNSCAILTEKKVLEMRELKKTGMKIKDIAKKYGVKYFTCLDALTGRNWGHI